MTLTGFSVRLPFDKLPVWRELRSLPLAAQKAALNDPARRAHLVDEALHGRYGEAIGAEARAPSYDMLRVFDQPDGPYRTVADIAGERGMSPGRCRDRSFARNQLGPAIRAALRQSQSR